MLSFNIQNKSHRLPKWQKPCTAVLSNHITTHSLKLSSTECAPNTDPQLAAPGEGRKHTWSRSSSGMGTGIGQEPCCPWPSPCSSRVTQSTQPRTGLWLLSDLCPSSDPFLLLALSVTSSDPTPQELQSAGSHRQLPPAPMCKTLPCRGGEAHRSSYGTCFSPLSVLWTASFQEPAADSPAAPWLPFKPAALCSEKQLHNNLMVGGFYSTADHH